MSITRRVSVVKCFLMFISEGCLVSDHPTGGEDLGVTSEPPAEFEQKLQQTDEDGKEDEEDEPQVCLFLHTYFNQLESPLLLTGCFVSWLCGAVDSAAPPVCCCLQHHSVGPTLATYSCTTDR